MAEGIELNIDTSGVRPNPEEDSEKKLLESMTKEQREEYIWIQSYCRREARLFSAALTNTLDIMPPPATYHEHRIPDTPRYDQGTLLVALKIYEHLRDGYFEALQEPPLEIKSGNGKQENKDSSNRSS